MQETMDGFENVDYAALWELTKRTFLHKLESLPRYDVVINDINHIERRVEIEPDEDGKYILFSDIKKLIDENTTKRP